LAPALALQAPVLDSAGIRAFRRDDIDCRLLLSLALVFLLLS
jgi:hypothetical protein